METKSPFFSKLAMTVWVVLVFLLGIYIFPWRSISWGTLKLANERTVTVTGSSQTQTKNQIATFTAGVNAVKDKKEDAVNEVNSKMDEIVKSVKSFGVKSEDIKTQSNSIYQMQETFYDNGVQKSRPGQWSVNNSVEIVLRNVDRATALADLLSKSGANNVYGPNFSVDTANMTFEADLAATAMEDARKKAEVIAKSSGASLGAVVNVVEGVSQPNIYPLMKGGMGGGGGGATVEPGSSTVAKTLTVTFRLE